MTPTSDAAAATKRTTTDVVRIAFENKRRTLTAVSLVSAFNGVVDKRRSTDSDQPTRVSAVDIELTIVTNEQPDTVFKRKGGNAICVVLAKR